MQLHKLLLHLFVVPSKHFFGERKALEIGLKCGSVLAIRTSTVTVALGAAQLLTVTTRDRSRAVRVALAPPFFLGAHVGCSAHARLRIG